nr:putative ribonuclease H-like domain-containing protein [Tanacetum cinerariifolium]
MLDVEPAIEEDNSHLGQWKSIGLENKEESSIPLNASRENPFFILFHQQMWQTVVLSSFTYTNKISAKVKASLFPHPKSDLSYTGLEELFNEPKTKKSKDKSTDVEPESVSKNSNAPIIEDWVSEKKEETVEKHEVEPSINRINFVKATTDNNSRETVKNGSNWEIFNKSCYERGSFEHLIGNCQHRQNKIKQQKMLKPVWNNRQRVNHKNHSNANRNHVPQAALTINVARPFNVVHPKRTMNDVNQESYFSKQPHSFVQRPNKKLTALKNSYANKKVKTVWVKKVNTTKTTAAVNAAKAKAKHKPVKRKKGDSIASITLKKFNYVVAQGRSKSIIRKLMGDMLPLEKILKDERLQAKKEKQYRASCKTKVENSISTPLHLLHTDLFGPTFVKSLNKKMYYLVVTDDYSRFTWVFFLGTKDETSGTLKSFITRVENLMNLRIKVIICDNETEFKNREMNQFCEVKGIMRQYSVARTPQQNRVAEKRNRTLIEIARTMLAGLKLPTTFWAETVNTACYVQNRVLVTKPHNKTPYELFHGKFDGKADEGFFVGYSLN